MVDVVGSVSIQSSAAKTTARGASSATVTSSNVSASASENFVSSSIRVDNLQNVAILEYRSSDGEVLQQYPTQVQIDAFTRARALERRELLNAGKSAQSVDVSVPDRADHAVVSNAAQGGDAAPQQQPSGASVEA